MLLKLDKNQQKAVEHFKGPALVVAGPGSGKTTVIKERILHLIRNHNVDPEKILAIAFTKAAVAEIEGRILAELNSNHGYPKIRTLHGFGKDIIVDNPEKSDFTVTPETWSGEIEKIIDQEREQLERNAANANVAIYKIQSQISSKCYIGQSINPQQRKKQHFRSSSNWSLRQAIKNETPSHFTFEIIEWVCGAKANERESHWIEYYRNSTGVFNSTNPLRQQYSNELMIEMLCQFFGALNIEQFKKILSKVKKEKHQVKTGKFNPSTIADQTVRSFAEKYEDAKQKAEAIDFEDMLIYSANILENSKNLCQSYRDRYPYVLVDEFQDISPADFRLISQLSKNLFAVGDDDQAIYGFRGGDSKIMLDFHQRQDVKKYKITRNYRSTSTIVEHSKNLIEHNGKLRIGKNLRPQNPMQLEIKIMKSTPETIENILLSELRLSAETAILTRTNYEIEKIQKMLNTESFPVAVSTIHKAKGKEWEKVVLIVNTLDVWDNGTPYISLPDDRNEVTEERRVFYVAVTRAKQKLVIFGGNCQFIPEFQNIPLTKENMEECFRTVLSAREPKLKIELEEASRTALSGLESRCTKELEKALEVAYRQYQPEFSRLRREVTENQNEKKKMKLVLQQEIKTENDTFLEGLIPVLDRFESFIKSLPVTAESSVLPMDLAPLTESAQLTHTQFLDLLKDHRLRPIETCDKIFNPSYHKKISSEIYSDEVPEGRVAREKQRGYLLHDQVIRKAEVVVSKGQNIRTPARLDRLIEIYLNRLIASKFGPKYDLDKPTIKRKMAKYLSELDDESLKKINSAATIDTTQYIKEQPLGNYCVGQATTHMCTDVVFRNFWKHMWEVMKQSKKTPSPKIKHVQPSVNKSLHTPKTQEKTSTVPSKKTVDRTLIWDEIATAYETGAPVKGHITERIQGGLGVSIGSLRGFLPASQVDVRSIQNLEQYVGQMLNMKVINLNKRRHNIVLSRRAWLEAELVRKRSEVLNTLEVDQCVTGVVKNITNFGAFVDLGGVDGLLHKTEMAWKRVNHPSEIVSIGEEIEVKVIKFNRENQEISLSLKQMASEPWENVEDKYPIGSKVSGVVVNIVDYGAFVQLEEGIVGLIHVSEMPLVLNNVLPLDLLNKGDALEVTILEIFKDLQRISLSIK